MKITVYKYILRDLGTMRRVGFTYAEQGREPIAPTGTFASKCVGSFVQYKEDEIIEVV